MQVLRNARAAHLTAAQLTARWGLFERAAGGDAESDRAAAAGRSGLVWFTYVTGAGKCPYVCVIGTAVHMPPRSSARRSRAGL